MLRMVLRVWTLSVSFDTHRKKVMLRMVLRVWPECNFFDYHRKRVMLRMFSKSVTSECKFR